MKEKKTMGKKHAKQEKDEQGWGVWVWVKWKPGTPSDAWKQWSHTKEIKEAWSTTGDWDCSLWVDVDNPAKVEKIVWEKIRANKWVDKTETHWSKKWW
jgi:DNA-binding Lrp family transcriptional regulator